LCVDASDDSVWSRGFGVIQMNHLVI